MSDQFYITLPSNTQQNSTASNFRVSLPQRLRLEGEWDVGLAEIIYPNSWFHLQKENYIFFKMLSKEARLKLNPGYYDNIDAFLNEINEALVSYASLHFPEIQHFKFLYDKKNNIVQFMVDTGDINIVTLSSELANMLGFVDRYIYYRHDDDPDENIGRLIAAQNEFVPFNLYYQTLFVYCNIVEDQIIGNSMAPLLRIVETQGKHGDLICKTYDSPHYIPVLLKDIQSIEINIKNDMNEYYKFEFGKVIVKLHLKKRTSY
jgi:hypothetical protein